jgi:hypothetical protein
MLDDEGMKLIIESGVALDRRMEDGLDNAIALPAGDQSDAREDPSRVGVDDEYGRVKGVQENRIRCLGSDPPLGEESLA